MTYAGAVGPTAEEMARVLHFTLPAAELHASFNWIDQQLTARASDVLGKDGKAARLRSDNLMFGVPDLQPRHSFLDLLAVNYGAGVQRTDLASAESLQRINDYVADRTEQRVPKLLEELPANTKLVLTNTVYVSSAWAKPFVRTNSLDQAFTTPTGPKDVPFMRSFEPYALVDTGSASAVELPLAIPGLAMDVIVPKGDLTAFEAELTGGSLSSLLDSMTSQPAMVSLPKLKLEPTAEGSLKPQLQALGMQMAFDSSSADFSGIANALTLADVVQKTYFTADEGGLEAAAGSAAIANTRGGAQGAFQLVADRPFLVVVRDVQTRAVLFLGHVVDPSAH